MNVNNIKQTIIMLSLLIGGSGIIYGNNIEYSQSTFIFCLKNSIEPLNINYRDEQLRVDNNIVQQLIDEHNIVNMERWLNGANDTDHDGDIYLNRIYRVYIGERTTVESLIEIFKTESIIAFAEPDFIRKPLYTPNDSQFDQQCSMPSVKAIQAWDFWNIPDVMPGDGQEILLASVDTGVDYTHPDLIESIWVNQGEIPSFIIDDLMPIIDTNGDGHLSASELISEEIMSDFNEDGIINLKDVLHENSPFIDDEDNDNNEYKDDLIGYDPAGTWGSNGDYDHDPFPKEDTPNNSTWAHGTHVGGILTATTDNNLGMASTMFNGRLMSVKTSIDGPSGDDPGIMNGYDGILYAAKAGYYAGTFTIINNSWGGGGYSQGEQNVINTVHDTYGAVVLAAAGNGNNSGGEEYAAHYPSSYANVISVAAIGCNGSWGNWATYHPTIDLSAPGENVLGPIIDGGYEFWMGSSMASPNAASCIGLLQSYYPEMDNDDLIERILNTADDFIYDINPDYLDCNGNNGEYCLGKGMVDVYEAIGIEISPNIILENVELIENGMDGDGDGVINPGEKFSVNLTLQNENGWQPAEGIEVVISSSSDGVVIDDNEYAYCEDLDPGEICQIDYVIDLSDTIELGIIPFELFVVAHSPDDYLFMATLDFEASVTLNQFGFPVDVSGELISSAALIDLDNDNQLEIISSDKAGIVHVFEVDGTEWETDLFPYSTGDQNWGSPAVSDLDNDGHDELVISSKNGHIYVFDYSGLKLDYDSDGYVTATPALGDIDGDGDSEIVFGQYGSPKQINAINIDGTSVSGFPYDLDEKVQRGAALCDFNGNGRDDIVIGADDEFVHLILDDGTLSWSYETGGDIRVAPTVLELTTGEKIILVGSKDNNFYALNSDGTLRFMIETEDDISTEASIVDVEGIGPIIFFSSDGIVYAVETNGEAYGAWPINIGSELAASIIFSDLNGDSVSEVIFGDIAGNLFTYNIEGELYNYFPIESSFPFKGSPIIFDLDGDDDLEIMIGTTQTLVNIDVKDSGNVDNYWNVFRSDKGRSGYYVSNETALSNFDGINERFTFHLNNAYPNPFNPNTMIEYQIPHNMEITLSIYNLNGRLIKVLDKGYKNLGIHNVVWDGTSFNGNSVSTGFYIYQLEGENNLQLTKKVILLK